MITTSNLLIMSAFVAGTPHRVAEGTDLSSVLVGDELYFRPDPSNMFDPSAIKVYHTRTNQDLGFVPREQTPILHELWEKDPNIALSATITARAFAKFKEIIFQVRLP